MSLVTAATMRFGDDTVRMGNFLFIPDGEYELIQLDERGTGSSATGTATCSPRSGTRLARWSRSGATTAARGSSTPGRPRPAGAATGDGPVRGARRSGLSGPSSSLRGGILAGGRRLSPTPAFSVREGTTPDGRMSGETTASDGSPFAGTVINVKDHGATRGRLHRRHGQPAGGDRCVSGMEHAAERQLQNDKNKNSSSESRHGPTNLRPQLAPPKAEPI